MLPFLPPSSRSLSSLRQWFVPFLIFAFSLSPSLCALLPSVRCYFLPSPLSALQAISVLHGYKVDSKALIVKPAKAGGQVDSDMPSHRARSTRTEPVAL